MKHNWWSVRGILGLGCLGFGGVLVQACLYDADQPCGEERVLSDDGLACVCPEEAVDVEGQCMVCADDEVATTSGCQCPEGQAKNGEDVCVEASLGADCSSDADCVAPFDFCEPDGGYCTSTGCTTSDECEGDYACATMSGSGGTGAAGASGMGGANGGDTFCQRQPTGLGMSCETSEDCAGTEATYCDPYFLTCLVENCNVEENNCFAGYQCCDLSAFNVPNPLCVDEELLEEGTCF